MPAKEEFKQILLEAQAAKGSDLTREEAELLYTRYEGKQKQNEFAAKLREMPVFGGIWRGLDVIADSEVTKQLAQGYQDVVEAGATIANFGGPLPEIPRIAEDPEGFLEHTARLAGQFATPAGAAGPGEKIISDKLTQSVIKSAAISPTAQLAKNSKVATQTSELLAGVGRLGNKAKNAIARIYAGLSGASPLAVRRVMDRGEKVMQKHYMKQGEVSRENVLAYRNAVKDAKDNLGSRRAASVDPAIRKVKERIDVEPIYNEFISDLQKEGLINRKLTPAELRQLGKTKGSGAAARRKIEGLADVDGMQSSGLAKVNETVQKRRAMKMHASSVVDLQRDLDKVISRSKLFDDAAATKAYRKFRTALKDSVKNKLPKELGEELDEISGQFWEVYQAEALLGTSAKPGRTEAFLSNLLSANKSEQWDAIRTVAKYAQNEMADNLLDELAAKQMAAIQPHVNVRLVAILSGAGLGSLGLGGSATLAVVGTAAAASPRLQAASIQGVQTVGQALGAVAPQIGSRLARFKGAELLEQ